MAQEPHTGPQPGDQYVQSLARGLAVIRAFDEDHPRMTLSEVAARAGVARAVARRLLLTLQSLGYVRSDDRSFELTGLVLELGYSYLATQPLAALAAPILDDLAARTGESASVATLDGTDIVYIARVHRRSIMRVNIHIGTRFPAYATSMGRVLLAGLPARDLDAILDRIDFAALTGRTVTNRERLVRELTKVRKQGWAMVDQELEVGLRSMAAPVRDGSGRTVAAVNVSLQVTPGEAASTRQRQVDTLVPLLKDAAEQLSLVVPRH